MAGLDPATQPARECDGLSLDLAAFRGSPDRRHLPPQRPRRSNTKQSTSKRIPGDARAPNTGSAAAITAVTRSHYRGGAQDETASLYECLSLNFDAAE